MDQKDNHDQPVEAKRRKDRGKLIFLTVIAVAVILVYISQRSGAELPNWPGDLPAALAKAVKADKKVLVFFAGSPPSATARWMSRTTLYKNNAYIREKFVSVLVQVKLTDEPAKSYNISRFPTFLVLDARGKELNRRVGKVGQTQFRDGFLDCSDVKTVP